METKKKIKEFILHLLFGNSLVRKGVHFGKGSYIREHCKVSGGNSIFMGNHARIFPYSRIECFTYISGEKFTPRMEIGDNVLLGRNTTILCANSIKIGANSLFASYCFISDENHGMDLSINERYECQKITTSFVEIGQNCWIGEKVIILPGVTIGDNTIVGAGSVVTRSLPANVIAVGNPVRIVKKYNYDKKEWEKV